MGILEIIGYFASVTIAVSMTMSSIVKFRIINLIGAFTFATYGYLIGALPIGLLNTFVVSVDIFYLYKNFSKKEVFETLEVRSDNRYLLRFVDFYNKDIQKFFPGFSYKPEVNTVSFFILRDMAVAGLFLARREDDNILRVGIDYVLPEYRDFKNGKFVYQILQNKFIEKGFTKITTDSKNKQHIKYLKKIGFKQKESGIWELDIINN
ncbi:MAG: hypothetical protein KGZ97_13020 [Bacteroidetes bacterium]|nr:hypothetical protein [Bacteroidota bacterium]